MFKKPAWILAAVLGLLMSVNAAYLVSELWTRGTYSITILHTNDVHARVLEFNEFDAECDEGDHQRNKCYGGAARRAALVKKLRAQHKNLLLLDGGDQFQGTLFYARFKGEDARTFTNLIGYDAMAVGNHEFDDGPKVLARFIQGVKFPVLSANIDASRDPHLKGLIKPYVIKEMPDGERVGIVGYTTEETPIYSFPGDHVKFLSIQKKVREAVQELEAQGVNKIFAVSHAGFGVDRQVAETVPGLDLIVAGHTNTYLSNNDPKAEGPYPFVVKNKKTGTQTLIVSSYAYGKYLGMIQVVFDKEGRPAGWRGNPILLDRRIEKDPQVLEVAQEMDRELEKLRKDIVGRTVSGLDGRAEVCRQQECEMGNFFADAVLWATRKQGVDFVIQNAGGMRSSLPPGEISWAHLIQVHPFRNTVSTYRLKGSDVIAVLENGVSQAENLQNDGTGRFPQVAGLRVTWSSRRPVGSRILSVEVREPDGRYSPLDPNRVYRVASNSFMRQGGDGFKVLKERATDVYDYGPEIAELMKEYLSQHSPVQIKVGGRIIRKDS